MSKHPDVIVGTVTDYEGGTLRVMVSGVEVVLTLTRNALNESIYLGPDEAIYLVKLLERALRVE